MLKMDTNLMIPTARNSMIRIAPHAPAISSSASKIPIQIKMTIVNPIRKKSFPLCFRHRILLDGSFDFIFGTLLDIIVKYLLEN